MEIEDWIAESYHGSSSYRDTATCGNHSVDNDDVDDDGLSSSIGFTCWKTSKLISRDLLNLVSIGKGFDAVIRSQVVC